MHRKFLWLIFFIILCSTASLCILYIPYPETQVKYNPTYSPGGGATWSDGKEVEFPWRAYNKEMFLNVSLTQGTIDLRIFDRYVDYDDEGGSYIPYWEILNTTGFTTTIRISPPIKGYLYIKFNLQNVSDYFNGQIYVEIKVRYLRYASSYGFFFLGVAVILISYYIYLRYQYRSK